MRVIFGLMSLLVALAVIGVLARKQPVARSAVPVSEQAPALAGPLATSLGASAQVQKIKQSVEAAMQQARPMPDE